MDDSTTAPPDHPPQELSWGKALRRVSSRYLFRGMLFLGSVVVAVLVGITLQLEALLYLTAGAVILMLPTSLVAFPASVIEERRESRLAIRRHELADAITQLDAVAPEDIDLTLRERFLHLVQTSKGPLLVAALLELLLLLPLLITLYMLWKDLNADEYATIYSVTVLALVLPVYVTISMLFGMIEDEGGKDAMANARIERAYREAVEDRAQLAGGLVLDEHVGARGGGELTVQAQAGGLAMHDEVVLDLDASAEGAAEHIEESQRGSRKL